MRRQLVRVLLVALLPACGSGGPAAIGADGGDPGPTGPPGGRRPNPAADGGVPEDAPRAPDAPAPRDGASNPLDGPRPPADVAPDTGLRPTDAMIRPVDAAPSGTTSCAADGECVITAYRRPVLSEADCYCVLCPGTVVNKATADLWAAQWRQQCTEWAKRMPCPVAACLAPPPTKCVAGQCKAGTNALPMTCPGDPTCAGGGARCGATCCRPGEWCDPEIAVCRCGSGPGCGRDECAVGGPAGGSRCGSFCCGLVSGRACPQ